MTPILQDHQILSRNSDVISTEVGGDLALMSIPNGCYYALNCAASAIWRKLEEPIRVDQLSAALIDEYNGDARQIEQDLREPLEKWLAWSLIEMKPSPPR